MLKKNMRTFHVEEADTAVSMGSGDLSVLATPALICMLEDTAKELLREQLPEGKTSVGTEIHFQHLAPTTVGEVVKCSVVLDNQERKMCYFSLEATAGSLLIGKGTHTRAIVDSEKFMNKLAGK